MSRRPAFGLTPATRSLHNHYTNILRRVRIMTTTDVVASNGVIHVIDAVLLPTA